MPRRHGIHVFGDAGAAGADIAHLRTAVFRVVIGLEFQRIPVVAARCIARDPALHPLLKALSALLHHCRLNLRLWRDRCVHQAAFVELGIVGCLHRVFS